MKCLAAALLALLFTPLLHAQLTWKGLRFGQTREAARAQLLSQNVLVEASQDGAFLQSTVDYDLMLPGYTRSIPLRVDVHFVDDHLSDVNLSVDLPAMRRNFPEFPDEGALLAFASDRLTRALTDKYGIPTFREPSCDPEPAAASPAPASAGASAAAVRRREPASCTVNWRGPDQSIGIAWFNHRYALTIRYQVLATDL